MTGAGGAAAGGGGAAGGAGGGAAGGGGAGGGSCGPCSPPVNGAAMCVEGACQVMCDLGYHKNGTTCDPNNTIGCCGPSCAMCPTRANATAKCGGMTSGCITPAPCDAGYHDCGGTCVLNNIQSCGPTCTPCRSPLPPNTAASSCDGTQCVYTCQSGFDACDGNRGDANGCEVNLNQDMNHCGTCAKVCPAAANATPVCTAAACGIACKPLFGNCNGSTTDGCEVNLTTSQINCGRCHPKAATVTANDLTNETDYNAHAGPPACREWLGEQCTATGTSTVALCQ